MGDSYHTGIPSSHRSPAKLQFAPVRPDLYRDIAGQRGVSAACRSEPLSARRVPAKYQLATVIPGFYKSCADSEDVSADLRRSVPSSARRAPINFSYHRSRPAVMQNLSAMRMFILVITNFNPRLHAGCRFTLSLYRSTQVIWQTLPVMRMF